MIKGFLWNNIQLKSSKGFPREKVTVGKEFY